MPFFQTVPFFFPVISSGSRNKRDVCLTFDDGPNPKTTPQLLSLLGKFDVSAAFFVTGSQALRYPELIVQICAAGHSIGNHSFSHDPFIMFRRTARLVEEIERTQEALLPCGIRPRLFRPPVGILTPCYKQALQRTGLTAITFSLRPGDMGNRRVTGLADRILARVKPGDIVLLHDSVPDGKTDVTVWLRQMEDLLQGLRNNGFSIVTLDKMIGSSAMDTGLANPGHQMDQSRGERLLAQQQYTDEDR